ncbi:MAG: branched-chain amino acid ABC transporter permease [Actinomycetota bacterium]
MLSSLVTGIFQGAVYGLLAVGLVLVYKGARVFNFAQGEFGTVGAFVTYAFFTNLHQNYLLAVILGLIASVALGLLMERLVVRPLLEAPRITLLVATAGVALLVIAVTLLVAQPDLRSLDPAIKDPTDPKTQFTKPFVVFNAFVTRQQLLILVVLGIIAVATAYFFNRTDRGLSVLASSEDATATRIVGISPAATSRLIWGLAALLGGIAGILQAPVAGEFTPGFMTTTTLIPAFTASVIGGMTSLPGAVIGGELVGIAQNVLGSYILQTKASVPGGPQLAVFGLLLVVLLVRPQGLLGKEAI